VVGLVAVQFQPRPAITNKTPMNADIAARMTIEARTS